MVTEETVHPISLLRLGRRLTCSFRTQSHVLIKGFVAGHRPTSGSPATTVFNTLGQPYNTLGFGTVGGESSELVTIHFLSSICLPSVSRIRRGY